MIRALATVQEGYFKSNGWRRNYFASGVGLLLNRFSQSMHREKIRISLCIKMGMMVIVLLGIGMINFTGKTEMCRIMGV